MHSLRIKGCGFAVAFIIASAAHAAPTVYFKTPGNGATISGYINGVSECSAGGRNIRRVEFFVDATKVSTDGDPSNGISCRFYSDQFANGSHTLKAVAYDSSGKTASAQISVNIQNGGSTSSTPSSSAPTVSFQAPAEGGTLSGNVQGPPNCTVTGANIAKVMFYLNGTWTNTDGNLDNGLGCWIDTTKYPDGNYTVKAVAYNAAGATASATRSIKIQNTPVNAPPSVTLTAPAAGATLAGYVNSAMCAATAADAGGSIARVEFYLGATLLKTDTTTPYQCNFESASFPDGTHTLMARATDNQGASATSQVDVKIQNGSVTPPPPPPGTGAIDPADILTQASGEIPFASQSGYNAQILGTYPPAPQIPESGIHGTLLPNGETLRLGKTPDPSNAGKQAIAFQLAPSDPNTSGSKRAEFKYPNNIEMEKVYWTAFKVWVDDWGTLGSSDNGLFGTQLHSGSTADLPPSTGLYAVANGRDFVVRVRGDGLSGKIDYAQQPIPFGRWADFVFKIRQSTGSSGMLQVWMDGNQIVNHSGPIGYNTGVKDYFKYGYYNWSGSAFASPRKVLLRSPVLVADPTGSTYGADTLRAFVNQ